MDYLLISEYQFVLKKEVKRKAPDYELYFEKIGETNLQNRESLLSLYFAFLQMLAEVSENMEDILPEELRETYIYQVRDQS